MSWLSDIQFIKTKMLHAAMKTIWAQKWKLLPVAKIKGKKRALDGVLFFTSQLTNHKQLLWD